MWARPSGLRTFEATFTFTSITARRLVVSPRETLSIGFRVLVSRHPAIQTTGLLTFAPAGLSPAEHASFRWTHIRTCGFPAYGSCLGCNDGDSQRRPGPRAVAAGAPSPVTRIASTAPGACFDGSPSPRPPPLAPPTPRPVARLRSSASQLLWRSSDFSCPFIVGYGSSPSRRDPATHTRPGWTRDLPVPAQGA